MINPDKEIRIGIRIDEKTKKEFQDVCKKKAINSSELIRQLIKDWTEQNK